MLTKDQSDRYVAIVQNLKDLRMEIESLDASIEEIEASTGLKSLKEVKSVVQQKNRDLRAEAQLLIEDGLSTRAKAGNEALAANNLGALLASMIALPAVDGVSVMRTMGVVLNDVAQIPEQYLEKPTPKTSLIEKALRRGEQVPGAELRDRYVLVVAK